MCHIKRAALKVQVLLDQAAMTAHQPIKTPDFSHNPISRKMQRIAQLLCHRTNHLQIPPSPSPITTAAQKVAYEKNWQW